jgi:hypothetical protein
MSQVETATPGTSKVARHDLIQIEGPLRDRLIAAVGEELGTN